MTIQTLKWELVCNKFKANKDLTEFRKGKKLVRIKHGSDISFFYDNLWLFGSSDTVDNLKSLCFIFYNERSFTDFSNQLEFFKRFLEEN